MKLWIRLQWGAVIQAACLFDVFIWGKRLVRKSGLYLKACADFASRHNVEQL